MEVDYDHDKLLETNYTTAIMIEKDEMGPESGVGGRAGHLYLKVDIIFVKN